MKIIFYILFTVFTVNIFAENFENIFQNANESYKKGDYQKAINLYQLIEKSNESDILYYNMGNAYAKLEKFGYAILYYEKSLSINPNNSDALFNLKMVNSKNIDKILDKSGKIETVGSNAVYTFLRSFDMTLLIIVFLVLWISFWIILIGKKVSLTVFKKNSMTVLSILLLIVILFNGMFIAGKYYSSVHIKLGVCVEREINVLEGPDESYRSLFTVHEGLKSQITSERNDWFEITLPNGNIGWVKKSSFKKI